MDNFQALEAEAVRRNDCLRIAQHHHNHKNRRYLVHDRSLKAWYLRELTISVTRVRNYEEVMSELETATIAKSDHQVEQNFAK